MANQFVPYPLYIAKTANGGYEVSLDAAQAVANRYVFANMADLQYWMALNEQPAPV